jgi:hypothetical protein
LTELTRNSSVSVYLWPKVLLSGILKEAKVEEPCCDRGSTLSLKSARRNGISPWKGDAIQDARPQLRAVVKHRNRAK